MEERSSQRRDSVKNHRGRRLTEYKGYRKEILTVAQPAVVQLKHQQIFSSPIRSYFLDSRLPKLHVKQGILSLFLPPSQIDKQEELSLIFHTLSHFSQLNIILQLLLTSPVKSLCILQEESLIILKLHNLLVMRTCFHIPRREADLFPNYKEKW